MKKNRLWIVFVGLFSLVTSGATVVYAASQTTQNHVGVGFVGSTSSSSTTSSTSSPSSTSSSTTSMSSSSTMQSTSSLPDTNQKRNGFLWLGNDGGGPSGTTRYYADDKLLPSTGELVHLALPFVGVFLLMLVFFFLRKERGNSI